MSELFNLRYPGRTPQDVILEYIRCHPMCTRADMDRDMPSVPLEYHLPRMAAKGTIRRVQTDRIRWEVSE